MSSFSDSRFGGPPLDSGFHVPRSGAGWRRAGWFRALGRIGNGTLIWALDHEHPWRLRAVMTAIILGCAAFDAMLLMWLVGQIVGFIFGPEQIPQWKTFDILLLTAAIAWLIRRAIAMVRGKELQPALAGSAAHGNTPER